MRRAVRVKCATEYAVTHRVAIETSAAGTEASIDSTDPS